MYYVRGQAYKTIGGARRALMQGNGGEVMKTKKGRTAIGRVVRRRDGYYWQTTTPTYASVEYLLRSDGSLYR